MIHTPSGQFPTPGREYLAATAFFDYDHPALQADIGRVVDGAGSDIDKAVRLYYWVRDGWRYDPFITDLSRESLFASHLMEVKASYCVPKANLLIAAARSVGIPAALGLADVLNHVTSDKLKRWMGGNTIFMNHGFAVLYLGGKWVKAAPAFNLEMCQRFGVRPTEFDGRSDAIFQEFDVQNRRHMEYVNDRGCWSDVPHKLIEETARANYPVDEWKRGIDDPYFAPNT